MTNLGIAEPHSRKFDIMTIARAFGPTFGRVTGFVERAIRMRRDRATLHAMPDHMLKDMGIARCAISSATRFRKTEIAGRVQTSDE